MPAEVSDHLVKECFVRVDALDLVDAIEQSLTLISFHTSRSFLAVFRRELPMFEALLIELAINEPVARIQSDGP